MSRTLFTILLIAAQILSGFWGNAALCIRSDGTICCIHELAAECSCCELGHDAAQAEDCHASGSNRVCAIAGNHEHNHDDQIPAEQFVAPLDVPLPSNVPCGCQHRPISSGSAPASQRSIRVTSAERLARRPQRPDHSGYRFGRSDFAVPGRNTINAPRCLTVGLTIAASTVIRC